MKDAWRGSRAPRCARFVSGAGGGVGRWPVRRGVRPRGTSCGASGELAGSQGVDEVEEIHTRCLDLAEDATACKVARTCVATRALILGV